MDRTALIVMATGRDRPGIVDQVAGVVYRMGANLEDSRMAVLGGEFALIVLLTGSAENLARVREGLEASAHDLELTLQFKETQAGVSARANLGPCIRYRIHAVALDHPGIVHKISRVLALHSINVASLDTSVSNAPVTGAPVFSLEIAAEVPVTVSVGKLRRELEAVAEGENIDLDLHAAD
jgi:glycine cleavage system transcriptional repressor